MIKSDKKVNELAINLKNPDVSVVAASIDLLRNAEPFEGAIGLLVKYYDTCTENTIKQLIAGFLNDLKDVGAKKEIIDSIYNMKKNDTRFLLITSCWQSGLDYSDNIDDFIKLFINNSYDIAFECLTVIEQSLDRITMTKKKEIIKFLKKKTITQPDDKTALVNELINVLHN
jgi:hypothetical protein